MKKHVNHRGILNEPYADIRLNKPECIFRYKVRANVVFDKIKKFTKINEDLKLLAFGAAEGNTLRELSYKLHSFELLGIEYSKELVNRATDLPKNIRVIQGDVQDLSNCIKNNSQDIVIAMALLEHLSNPFIRSPGSNENIKARWYIYSIFSFSYLG